MSWKSRGQRRVKNNLFVVLLYLLTDCNRWRFVRQCKTRVGKQTCGKYFARRRFLSLLLACFLPSSAGILALRTHCKAETDKPHKKKSQRKGSSQQTRHKIIEQAPGHLKTDNAGTKTPRLECLSRAQVVNAHHTPIQPNARKPQRKNLLWQISLDEKRKRTCYGMQGSYCLGFWGVGKTLS